MNKIIIYNQLLQYKIQDLYNLEKLFDHLKKLEEKKISSLFIKKNEYLITNNSLIKNYKNQYFNYNIEHVNSLFYENYINIKKKIIFKTIIKNVNNNDLNYDNIKNNIYINKLKLNKYRITQLPLQYFNINIEIIKLKFLNINNLDLIIEIHNIEDNIYIKSYLELNKKYINNNLNEILSSDFIKNDIQKIIEQFI